MQAALGDDIVIDALAVLPPAVITRRSRPLPGVRPRRGSPTDLQRDHLERRRPPVPLYSCGARLTAIYTLGPLLMGCGINITLVSYQDRVEFGVAVCPDVVEEPWELAEGIPEALAVLRKAVDAA